MTYVTHVLWVGDFLISLPGLWGEIPAICAVAFVVFAAENIARVARLPSAYCDTLGFIDTLDLLIFVGSGRIGAPRVPSADI
jgi:hypothetical protein